MKFLFWLPFPLSSLLSWISFDFLSLTFAFTFSSNVIKTYARPAVLIYPFLSRPPAPTWMFTFKLSWVNTSSTSPRQQSYAAALCVLFTAAAYAKFKTATSTCIWALGPTVSTMGMTSQRSQASLMRQRRRGSRQISSASATVAMRASTASVLTCHHKPQKRHHYIL